MLEIVLTISAANAAALVAAALLSLLIFPLVALTLLRAQAQPQGGRSAASTPAAALRSARP